jgi:Ca2+-binding EF-hand superfamily protein
MKTTMAVWGLLLGVTVAATPAVADFREEMQAARDAAFTAADGDGDGALTPAEFETFHARMEDARSEAMFARRDENGDGRLTADELDRPRSGKHGCRH